MQGDALADRPPMQLIHYSQLLCHFDLQHQALKHSCLFITALNSTKKATASLIVTLQAVTSHDTVSTLHHLLMLYELNTILTTDQLTWQLSLAPRTQN